MPILHPALLTAALWLGAVATEPPPVFDEPQTVCNLITIGDLEGKGLPKFSAFPAPISPGLRPVSVNLKSHPRARLYRTRIREGAAEGPNFAGHFTIVGWGCGAACLQWAVVDAKTRVVYFPPEEIARIGSEHVNTAPGEPEPSFYGLRFQADSALLVILGAPNADKSWEGISLYRWTGKAFRFVRSEPIQRRWCEPIG